MPIEMERIKDEIWRSIKDKINPRTKKSYTESDAYAIATDAYNKKYGGSK